MFLAVALTLAVEPERQAIQAGQTAVYTVSAQIQDGYARPVELALAGLPPGTTSGFDPNPILPLASSRLAIRTTVSAGTGVYPLALTATAGSVSATAELTLILYPPGIEYPFKGYLPCVLREASE